MKDQSLIIGIVVALGVGFLIGFLSASRESTTPIPANYDPARAAFADALHEQSLSSERCWKSLIDVLGRQTKEARGEAVGQHP